VDRTTLGKLPDGEAGKLLRRLSRVLGVRPKQIRAKLLDCGDAGAVAGTCWNGSPYQPVPVAEDVDQAVALRILEQGEDYPAVVAQRRSLRTYPRPYGINAAHLLGYLSPITEE